MRRESRTDRGPAQSRNACGAIRSADPPVGRIRFQAVRFARVFQGDNQLGRFPVTVVRVLDEHLHHDRFDFQSGISKVRSLSVPCATFNRIAPLISTLSVLSWPDRPTSGQGDFLYRFPKPKAQLSSAEAAGRTDSSSRSTGTNHELKN